MARRRERKPTLRRRQVLRCEWCIDGVSHELRPPNAVDRGSHAVSDVAPRGLRAYGPADVVSARNAGARPQVPIRNAVDGAREPRIGRERRERGKRARCMRFLSARSIHGTNAESIITVLACIASISPKESLPWASFSRISAVARPAPNP